MAVRESISVDGGPHVETDIRNPERADWIAGPLPLGVVDVTHDGHVVLIVSGERVGYEAAAGHGVGRLNPEDVYLNGREPFEPTEGDPNQAAARIVRKATEKK